MGAAAFKTEHQGGPLAQQPSGVPSSLTVELEDPLSLMGL